MKVLVLLLTMSLSMTAVAGPDWTEVGNGGDVIYCSKNPSSPFNFKLYDIYETQYRYGKTVRMPFYQLPPRKDDAVGHDERYIEYAEKIAKEIIARLELHDSEMVRQLTLWVEDFKVNSRFVAGELLDIPDTGIGVLPPNCVLKQLVIQRTPKFPEDRLYLVAVDYWKFMSLDAQAATIVHEVIYRYALSRNPSLKTSEPVRYFVGLLISGDVHGLTPGQFADIRGKMGF